MSKLGSAPAVRFWSRVEVKSPEECWMSSWGGGPRGYGTFSTDGRNIYTHRYAYQLFYGQIPKGLVIRHSCDTPGCCNPYHLSCGTQTANTRDRDDRGRTALGERNGLAKLTNAKVREIRTRYAEENIALRGLAKDYGVAHTTILRIVNGRIWRHT